MTIIYSASKESLSLANLGPFEQARQQADFFLSNLIFLASAGMPQTYRNIVWADTYSNQNKQIMPNN